MSPDGTWNVTMNSPMGAQAGTIELKSNGDTLEGTMTSPQGTAPIEDGKIDGSSLSWAITAQQMSMKITFIATIDGDNITGEADIGAFGKAAFTGTRA
jgi:hypothetical protein